jgi:hypothetical protein
MQACPAFERLTPPIFMSVTSEILSETKLQFSLKVDAGSARANPASEAQSALFHKNLKNELAVSRCQQPGQLSAHTESTNF